MPDTSSGFLCKSKGISIQDTELKTAANDINTYNFNFNAPLVNFAGILQALRILSLFQHIIDLFRSEEYRGAIGGVRQHDTQPLQLGETGYDMTGMSNLGIERLKTQEAVTNAEIYTRLIMCSTNHGLPCAHPEPHPSIGEMGIIPGDVGTFNLMTGFKKLFNLKDPGFVAQHGPPSMETTVQRKIFKQGHTIASGTTSRLFRSNDGSHVTSYQFECRDKQGAVLVSTTSADLEELVDPVALERFLRKHGKAVYQYANSIRGIGDQECLFVVTGSIKSDSWGIAAYEDPTERSGEVLEFSRIDADENVPSRLQIFDWIYRGVAEARFGSNSEKVGEDYRGKDQALFIRGITLDFKQEFRDRENAHLQVNLKHGLDDSGSNDPHPNAGGSGQHASLAGHEGFTNSLGTTGSTGGATDSLPCGIQVNYFPQLSNTIFNPSERIAQHLLELTGADCALCRDEDWRHNASFSTPSWGDAACLGVIASKSIDVLDGVAYLIPGDEGPSLNTEEPSLAVENEVYSSLVSDNSSVPPQSFEHTGGSSQRLTLSMSGIQDFLRPLQPLSLALDTPAASTVHSGPSPLLLRASHFQMTDVHINANTSNDKSIDGWERLLRHTAPNALHDSHYRYDAPKCDEDTRVAVTKEIMAFIQDRDSPSRLLCMTGAAGCGKSTLQQTIAKMCEGTESLASSFAFSSADPSRNTVKPVVPTTAYQLGSRNPAVKDLIKAAVEKSPLIFSRSLQDQITTLIVRPFMHLRDVGSDLSSLPFAILIDGLDECRGEDSQAELLASIKECLLVDWLPFRIFIASRPEWAICTALEPGGYLHQVAYHIRLSDQYDASEDMRRYLKRRFEDIGLRIGDSKWFSAADIESLIEVASGQFVYVATAYNFISQPRASPAERLKIVVNWTPQQGQMARPFEALDQLYTNILSTAKNAYEAVATHHEHDFLLLFRAHHLNIGGFQMYDIMRRQSADLFSVRWLGLEAGDEESLVSDLHSLVALERDEDGSSWLRLYHKSFSDFLQAEGRAKDLFVSEARIYKHVTLCLMQRIIKFPLDFDAVPERWQAIPQPDSLWPSLNEAVEILPFCLSNAGFNDDLPVELVIFAQNSGWRKIDQLLPRMYAGGCLFDLWVGWIEDLDRFTNSLKPEASAVLNAFVGKWKRDEKEWRRGRRGPDLYELKEIVQTLNSSKVIRTLPT